MNKEHNISFFADQRLKGLDLRVPSGFEIITERFVCRNLDGESVSIPAGNPSVSAAGLKLKAFIDLFDEAWYTIDGFISDSFWLGLAMGKTTSKEKKTYAVKGTKPKDYVKRYRELPGSNISGQRSFFSHKDIENELAHRYLNNQEKITERYTTEGLHLSAKEVLKIIDDNIEHDVTYEIDPSLQYFVQQNALYIGLRVNAIIAAPMPGIH